MSLESSPQPEKDEEQPVTRREFLKKAGKFLGGAIIAGHMGEQLYGAGRMFSSKTNEEPKRMEVFDPALFLQELNDLKKKYAADWEAEACRRFEPAVRQIAESLQEDRKAEQNKNAGAIGFGIGATPLFLKSLSDMAHQGETFTGQEVVDRLNNILLSASLGKITFGLLSKEGLNSKQKKEFVEGAINIALKSLPSEEDFAEKAEKEEKDYGAQLRATIIENTANNSFSFLKRLGLKSQLEQWAAGSALTLDVMESEAKKITNVKKE